MNESPTSSSVSSQPRKKNVSRVLVTGGGGFLGKHIVRQLLEKGYEVCSLSRGTYPELEKLGVQTIKGDISQYDDVYTALNNTDAVIHTAAKAGIWGRKQEYLSINYIGSKNIVRACQEHGIKYLIYTSSPSVVFGEESILRGDEAIPYPKKYLTYYSYSKMLAESYILKAHSGKSLKTLALRPHLIWGPEDPHFIPRLKERQKTGKLKRVGPLDNLVDVIYVENAAEAHVLALETLIHKGNIGGKPYFLGQESPVNLWSFINQLLVAAGGQSNHSRSVNAHLCYAVGDFLEKIYRLFGIYHKEPIMTRFLANQLTKSYYFSHHSARKAFGYEPRVSLQEGLARVAQYEASAG